MGNYATKSPQLICFVSTMEDRYDTGDAATQLKVETVGQ
jgi:hypothetical protein